MYSSLFRELHASRLQLDMTSSEERELTSGPADDVANDVIDGNDSGVISDPQVIYESPPNLTDDQDHASFGNDNIMPSCASLFQMPLSRGLLGSYYGSNVSNASPGGAFVSHFVTNDGVVAFDIPYVLRSIEQTGLVGCPGLAMAAVVLPQAIDITSSITSSYIQHQQHQHQQQQQHEQLLEPSVVDAQQVQISAAIPSSSSLVGFSLPLAADVAGVISSSSVPSSSSSASSSTSSSSLSVMSASGAGGGIGVVGGGGGGWGESSEDGATAAAAAAAADDDDPPGCCGSSSSKASSSRESPHSGIFISCGSSNRGDDGLPIHPLPSSTAGPPPPHPPLVGGGVGGVGGGQLDHRSTPPLDVDPSRVLIQHSSSSVAPILLDHRRNSLELSSGSRELVDGTSSSINHLSQSGVGVASAAGDVPAHLRRASIPCMSFGAARGLARGAAAHLAHRPSVPLDYESLKVKLEELTGTVTDGKRAKEGAGTGGDRSRRTSIVSLAHPPMIAAASGVNAMTPHPEVNGLTPTLTSAVGVVAGEGTAAAVGSYASLRKNGFTAAASYAVDEADEETDNCHHLLQLQSTGDALHEPIDAIRRNAKISQNPSEDFSSSSSSSTSSSLSSSSLSSSSSWDKLRLQFIIEHVLQYDVRLQEILKRHELEMAAIQLRHRHQWVELDKALTQKLGDQWKKFVTIPALSARTEGGISTTSPWRYPASTDGLERSAGQHRVDEAGCSGCVAQNPFDPLHTIRESQMDEDQLDSNNATRICEQTTATTTMQQNGRLIGDSERSSTVDLTDHAGRRCSADVYVDTPQRPRAISLSNVLLVGEKATTPTTATGESVAESRICQNIASSLARRQSSVAIMNPNSSRLHRHTTTASTREVAAAAAAAAAAAPSIRPDTFAVAPTRPDSSASSTRPDPSAPPPSSIRPDCSSASSSRPSTPLQEVDYRQLLLLAQTIQNQTNYNNSRMAAASVAQLLLPNVLSNFSTVPFQTTNFAAASYGCDPASMMALNSGILPMEMGGENGIDLNGLRHTHALQVEVPPHWTSGPQSALKHPCSLQQQSTGEETARGGLPAGYAQPLNGFTNGLSQEMPGIGHTGTQSLLQGNPLFPGLLPSHLAPCQLPSIVSQNPWGLLRTSAGGIMADAPMNFVTPSSGSIGFPAHTMHVPNNPAFYSLLKEYSEHNM